MKKGKTTGGALKTVSRIAQFLGKSVFLLLLWLWATLAIYYSNLPWAGGRTILAVAFALGTVVALLVFPNRARTIRYFLFVFSLLLFGGA